MVHIAFYEQLELNTVFIHSGLNNNFVAWTCCMYLMDIYLQQCYSKQGLIKLGLGHAKTHDLVFKRQI